jgi:hypothetical protein
MPACRLRSSTDIEALDRPVGLVDGWAGGPE